MNIWKYITFGLLILVLGLSFSLVGNNAEIETYNFGNFEIPKAQLRELSNAVSTNSFMLCSIKDNSCTMLQKIG